MKREKPKVFISYSSRDNEFVDCLVSDLIFANIPVWIDKWEIKVGDSIISKINEGIKDSDYLAIILSPNSVSSSWVQQELNPALMKELESRSVVVLPLLYQDCEIPLIIKDKKYADFRQDYQKGLDSLMEVFYPGTKSLVHQLDSMGDESIYLQKSKGSFSKTKFLPNLERRIKQSNSVQDVWKELLRAAAIELQTNYCYLLLMDNSIRRLRVAAWHAPHHYPRFDIATPNSIVGYTFASRFPMLFNDVALSDIYVPQQHNTRSELSVPILYEFTALGVFNAESQNRDHFTKSDITVTYSLIDAAIIRAAEINQGVKNLSSFIVKENVYETDES